MANRHFLVFLLIFFVQPVIAQDTLELWDDIFSITYETINNAESLRFYYNRQKQLTGVEIYGTDTSKNGIGLQIGMYNFPRNSKIAGNNTKGLSVIREPFNGDYAYTIFWSDTVGWNTRDSIACRLPAYWKFHNGDMIESLDRNQNFCRYTDGYLHETGKYKQCERWGVWKTFYPDGALRSMGSFGKAVRIPTSEMYQDSVENARSRTDWVFAVDEDYPPIYPKTGEWQYYAPDGRITRKEWYDPQGNLIQEEIY